MSVECLRFRLVMIVPGHRNYPKKHDIWDLVKKALVIVSTCTRAIFIVEYLLSQGCNESITEQIRY